MAVRILSFISADGMKWDSVGSFEGNLEVKEPELLFQKLEQKIQGPVKIQFFKAIYQRHPSSSQFRGLPPNAGPFPVSVNASSASPA